MPVDILIDENNTINAIVTAQDVSVGDHCRRDQEG
jgi:hypothetical protein